MWNSYRTDAVPSMTAGAITYTGGGGDQIQAYVAQPDGPGPFPGVLLIHHLPGWDEFYQEFSRRFANNGFLAMSPNYYARAGHGTPDDVAAAVRAAGGVSDDQVVADSEAALAWLKSQPTLNGKVGVIGTCSGGRHALLVASRAPGFDAVADLWGGGVVSANPPNQPVPVIEMTPNLNAPLLGIFGNEDQSPSPEQVNQHEAALRQYGKTYMFHRYDGAAHGFMYYHRPSYRVEQTMDAWAKVGDFFNRYLRA